MFRFCTTLQCVSDILHYSKKIIRDVSEFLIINVSGVTQDSKSLIKFHYTNPLSDILQSENVTMPKAKKVKVNWFKLFENINSNQKKSRCNKKESVPKNCQKRYKLEHGEHRASCSVPESATSSSESKDCDVLIVFDSKDQKLRDAQLEVVTIDSDENDISVSSMGNSDSLACGSTLQHNPGSWYCSAATWAGSDIQSSCSSELAAAQNTVLKSVQPGDGASETAAASFSQKDGSKRKTLKEKRQWQYTGFGSFLTSSQMVRSTPYHLLFTIMSYNVLAQDLLESHQYLYRGHNRSALKWKHRSRLLLSEIKEANADILCLQEVQANQLDTFYSQLKDLGYMGIYKQRTGSNVDGVAIYYKTDMFDLADHTSVEYYQPGISILDRHNVGLIAKLAIKANPSKHLVVATTHLLFNQNRHDVKLAQTQLLLTEVERFAFENRYGSPTYWPVIITGDMNFEPYTGVYQLLTEGAFRYEGLSSTTLTSRPYGRVLNKELLPKSLDILNSCQYWGILNRRKTEKLDHKAELKLLKIYNTDHQRIMKELNMISETPKSFEDYVKNTRMEGLEKNFAPCIGPSTFPPMPEAGYATGQLTHSLNLRSVYKHRKKQYHGSEVTTHHRTWVTVDYIFYSCIKSERYEKIIEGNLKLVSRYRLLTASEAESFGPIPNFAAPSDHYPLLATFYHSF